MVRKGTCWVRLGLVSKCFRFNICTRWYSDRCIGGQFGVTMTGTARYQTTNFPISLWPTTPELQQSHAEKFPLTSTAGFHWQQLLCITEGELRSCKLTFVQNSEVGDQAGVWHSVGVSLGFVRWFSVYFSFLFYVVNGLFHNDYMEKWLHNEWMFVLQTISRCDTKNWDKKII